MNVLANGIGPDRIIGKGTIHMLNESIIESAVTLGYASGYNTSDTLKTSGQLDPSKIIEIMTGTENLDNVGFNEYHRFSETAGPHDSPASNREAWAVFSMAMTFGMEDSAHGIDARPGYHAEIAIGRFADEYRERGIDWRVERMAQEFFGLKVLEQVSRETIHLAVSRMTEIENGLSDLLPEQSMDERDRLASLFNDVVDEAGVE